MRLIISARRYLRYLYLIFVLFMVLQNLLKSNCNYYRSIDY